MDSCIHKDWSNNCTIVILRLRRGWILPSRPPQRPLAVCDPMVCSVVSPLLRWNQIPVCLEEANLLLQSDLHENAHEVVQFTDCFGALVCS